MASGRWLARLILARARTAGLAPAAGVPAWPQLGQAWQRRDVHALPSPDDVQSRGSAALPSPRQQAVAVQPVPEFAPMPPARQDFLDGRVGRGGPAELAHEGAAESVAAAAPAAAPGGPASAANELELKLELLRSCGVPEAELARMLAAGALQFRRVILRTSLASIRQSVDFLAGLGIPRATMGKVLLANQFIASSSVAGSLCPNVEFLVAKTRLTPRQVGKMDEQIGSLLSKYPVLLGLSIESMQRRIDYLQKAGLSLDRVAKLVKSHPQIMGLSIQSNIEPTFRFLEEECKVQRDKIQRILRWPALLTYSVDDNLRKKLEYFLSIGFEREEFGSLVWQNPIALGVSLEANLKPKMTFLRDVMGRDAKEVMTCPLFLTYSLDRVIEPRWRRSLALGVHVPLQLLVRPSESAFERALNKLASPKLE
eukprot:SM000073S21464  [mRNA]  locus=s73:486868:489041:- [translate_table: standard]